MAVAALVVVALRALTVVVVPLAVALLLTALLIPLVRMLHDRLRFPVNLASFAAILLLLIAVGGLLAFAGATIASGMTDLLDQARSGLDSVIAWLHTGPLHLSDTEINRYLKSAEGAVTSTMRLSPRAFFSIQVSAPAWSRTLTQVSRFTITSNG